MNKQNLKMKGKIELCKVEINKNTDEEVKLTYCIKKHCLEVIILNVGELSNTTLSYILEGVEMRFKQYYEDVKVEIHSKKE